MHPYLKTLSSKIYLAGNFISKPVEKSYQIQSPLSEYQNFSNQVNLANIANANIEDAKLAVNSAYDIFDYWKNISSLERAKYLLDIADYMLKHQQDLGELLHLEQGKPLAEAIGEIAYSASYFTWFAHQAQSMHGETLNSPCVNKQMYTIKQAIGVCAAITPFNFPSAMIARKLAPALAVGCPMIIKPASDTPLSALAYGIIADEIGLPKGLLSILPADYNTSIDLGKYICKEEKIRKLSFTGSSNVGKILMAQCASNIKRLSLELGGNAPFIVTKYANIENAVIDGVKNKFRNAGQTCVCTNRFFVHNDVLPQFIQKFKQEVAKIQISPLINIKAVNKAKLLMQDAINKGAILELGGNINGLYYEPTILSSVNDSMDIYHQEIFAPIASIISYNDIKDVVKQANNTPYGLASYVYTDNINEVNYFTKNLECGMLGINTGAFSSHAFPFGGVKQSGFGKEGSIYGIDEYTITKAVCMYEY
jgi:succinate-semialdehyde dehydrogenase/glutarate-semialdehyde dehydrogenase